MRGRSSSNGNRRGQNPLTRVFESNGPDVKIRGTAAHIAEKYVQLARDSQTTGDHVAAENYLQHAEHYFRMISAAQAQFQQSQGYSGRPDEPRDDSEEDEEPMMPGLTHPGLARLHEQERASSSQPQPSREPPPARYSDQPRYPDQPRFTEPQPQPVVGEEAPAFGGLPAFITGAQPPAAGMEGAAGEREARGFRRRRRHRFPSRGDQAGGEGGEGGEAAAVPAGDPPST
jgi:hypothetical protein